MTSLPSWINKSQSYLSILAAYTDSYNPSSVLHQHISDIDIIHYHLLLFFFFSTTTAFFTSTLGTKLVNPG